ncbi:hypothetical protein PWEIH_00305 [Listeria weihenstephanensis FSL R9-0317]|uniref:Uncharacterized protein n=2 Tax=Listeria weihenstephanensis TaxID=1006155 RepID=A0A1S7FSV4_9LIST|nr:hypothetical protein UE46_04985 [Listeria weihenstephanensis]EUJ41459.1 hypothetical protein PWEIH_00305 [Listeria weihenstephanensis FSL R9-0317]
MFEWGLDGFWEIRKALENHLWDSLELWGWFVVQQRMISLGWWLFEISRRRLGYLVVWNLLVW